MAKVERHLTFVDIRKANESRDPYYRNARGEIVDHDTWSLNDWYTAASGELGELGNLLKKIKRGDFTLAEAKEAVGDEIADTILYLDFLASKAGINLGQTVAGKFNKVSRRLGADVWLEGYDK